MEVHAHPIAIGSHTAPTSGGTGRKKCQPGRTRTHYFRETVMYSIYT